MPETGDVTTGSQEALIHLNVKGNLRQAKTSEEKVKDDIHEHIGSIREKILQLPSQEDGMNMDRVYAYRDSNGLPKKDIRILNPDDYTKALKIANRTKMGHGNKGLYLAEQDIIILKRDQEIEELNGGPEFTECELMHEIVHGNNVRVIEAGVETQSRLLRKDNVDVKYYKRRSGLGIRKDGRNFGAFLDEGYSELERGLYMTQELGKSDGFAEDLQANLPPHVRKYLTKGKDADGNVKAYIADGAGVAAIFELIIEHDPGLLPALRESRQSVEGLREVAKRLDAVGPGLYVKLRNLDISADGALRETILLYQNVYSALQAKKSSQQ